MQFTATLADAATATISPFLRMSWGTGAVVDMTLRLGLPQVEKGPCASSPILPPAGVPGFATRAADRTRITGLSIGAATLLVQCQSQGASGGTLIPGGYGPPDSYDNSSYLAIDAAGACSWTAPIGRRRLHAARDRRQRQCGGHPGRGGRHRRAGVQPRRLADDARGTRSRCRPAWTG